MRLWPILLSLTAIASCTPPTQTANPALWEVKSETGQVGWLFGTIHTSPNRLEWETPAVHAALEQADEIVVEVGNLANEAEVGATFADLARNKGQPPLSQRIDPSKRRILAALLKKGGYKDGDFAAMDTWAAALTLANAGTDKDDARNGVDRAVIDRAEGREIVELEGARRQLGLFDSLPEREQRDLLGAVAVEASEPDRTLSESWRLGDMAAIEMETRRGLLSDPELREVLFTQRNRDWSKRIAQAIAAGRKPFVAVGAAHMAGADGLPAMLEKRGFKVRRVE